MGIKSQIKLFKTFFQQQLEPADRQVLEVSGSTIKALTSQGYLEVREIATGLLDGYYLLSQLELLAKLIADDVCIATKSHINFAGVEVEFSPLSGYQKFDYSSFEGNEGIIETQQIASSTLLKEIKATLPFLDSKSNTSAFLLHNNYLYAHNGIAIIKHFSECELSFQVTPSILQIITVFLEQHGHHECHRVLQATCPQSIENGENIRISIREKSLKIESPLSTILLPKHGDASQTRVNLDLMFNTAENYQDFDLDLDVVKRGIEALDLLENAEMRVLVIEETDNLHYALKSVCGKVKLKDLPKPNKLFNFAARSSLLNTCISHFKDTFEVRANILADKNTASMILFSDYEHDSQIMMSCILTN